MQDNRTPVRSLTPRRPRARRAAGRTPAPVAALHQDPDGWWDDLDTSILAALADGGKSPRELGETLGVSEQSMTSLLYMLAVQGRVRISRVEMVAV